MRGPKATIHLDRLIANYNRVKTRVNHKPIMAVVKANGYGHGAVGCAQALESHGCQFFGVFTLEEGIELRDAGITSDILVFSRMDTENLNGAIQNNLTLNVANSHDVDVLVQYYKSTGQSPKFHLKVETGMTRLGIDMDAMDHVIHQLVDHPHLPCEGIYSHYATADEGDLTYALAQEAKFKSVLALAAQKGIKFNHIHFSNSGAVLNMDQSEYNLIRVGMLLYGAYPSDEVPQDLNIQPVMTFTAPIVNVRHVPQNTAVSYGGVYHTKSDTNIGVIQCGFSDGLPRPWYVDGYVSYGGINYPIAGRICMDQFMVDFGDTEPIEGEDVLLMGKWEEGEITMETIAKSIDSTPYVLSTAIGGRTERIYQD